MSLTSIFGIPGVVVYLKRLKTKSLLKSRLHCWTNENMHRLPLFVCDFEWLSSKTLIKPSLKIMDIMIFLQSTQAIEEVL